MHTRNRFLIAGCLAAMLIALVAAFALSNSANAPTVPEPVSEQEAIPAGDGGAVPETPAIARAPGTPAALTRSAEPSGTATLVVDGTRYALTAPEGATLQTAMDKLATESTFTYRFREYAGLGAFVTTINGRAGTDEYVWILYVNGKESGTGISQTHMRSGDVIEWKLEESY